MHGPELLRVQQTRSRFKCAHGVVNGILQIGAGMLASSLAEENCGFGAK